MIVYRCLTSNEILNMINNKNNSYKDDIIRGENTFNYEKGVDYKHFFIYSNHAEYFRKRENEAPARIDNKYPVIGEYIIPNEIIDQHGFGYYFGVTTLKNSKLSSVCVPLPEVIVKEKNLKKEYLYRIKNYFNSTKILEYGDNEKYNEKIEPLFHLDYKGFTHMYSYSDIYYELLYSLFKKYKGDTDKVMHILRNIDLNKEISNYYENNKNVLKKQLKEE